MDWQLQKLSQMEERQREGGTLITQTRAFRGGTWYATWLEMPPDSHHRQLIQAQRHTAALRAFHTGLVAETHRHLRVLYQIADHIDILRHPERTVREKASAAHAACERLRALESLKRPWRETYRDFRTSLRRTRTILVGLARGRARRLKRAR